MVEIYRKIDDNHVTVAICKVEEVEGIKAYSPFKDLKVKPAH